jgi:transposase
MFIRRCTRRKADKVHVYWQLVESYRTERGPRQRVVAYLGDMARAERDGIERLATGQVGLQQNGLLGEGPAPEWVEVDASRVRVERVRDFGGYWLGLQVLEKLGLVTFLEKAIGRGHEDVRWHLMAVVLVLTRLCHPSSELSVADHLYGQSALEDLLGIPDEKVNDDRLYRALDSLLPQKRPLEKHLKGRLGELFAVEYDLLLYDLTSTYFEGEAKGNDQATRGYSRDHRPDCKQVCIALIVSRGGMPLGYEVFAGNRTDVTTVQEIVARVEKDYGQANRVWVMDRGMVSEGNIAFLREGGRRYIVGTAKGQLRRFERELVEKKDWQQIRAGVEVKLCRARDGEGDVGGKEVFILCRSTARATKEKAIHERFEKKIEAGLGKLVESCGEKKRNPALVERRVGALLAANSRAKGLFKVEVRRRENGGAEVIWEKRESWREWCEASEGCYLLRSNIVEWSSEALWEAYIQLTEAEGAFRVEKSDLRIRPIWHQKKERVQAHILVCFLAYVVWKVIGAMGRRAGLGDEPRQVLAEISRIKVVDVVLPTRSGAEIRKRCVTQPDAGQSVMLARLGLTLPRRLEVTLQAGNAAGVV